MMLLAFCYSPLVGEEIWINPRDVAMVKPADSLFSKGEPVRRASITLTCGKEIIVLDTDHMVAKIIRDAQKGNGW